MVNYFRVMLGRKSVHAADCFSGNFIGADFGIHQDLSQQLPEDWKEFNKQFIPVFLAGFPDKTKISAGLACGALWTISKGIKKGDLVLCPDGAGNYRVGEVVSEYFYSPGEILPHRRRVNWLKESINRADMSDALRNSTGSIGTVSQITHHQEEIERLMGKGISSPVLLRDETIEDLTAFALEKHLEEFLVKNWGQTDLGKEYDIFTDDGEVVGQQFQTDTGPLDILAIRKDRKELLVIELKKGRASDAVVGQILRYMGYVKQELAEPDQAVRGVIIALEDDQRIRRALATVPQIDFYRYQLSFKLLKV